MKKLIGIFGIAVAVMLVLGLMPHVGFGQSEVDPTIDRVGFPEGYQEDFSIFYEFDRTQNGSARVIYANEAASAVQPDQPFFPYGSVLVMEVHRTQKDDDGKVLLDKNGSFVKDELFGLFVMRKERGFGAKYGEQRNGEWEYAAYRPDGSVLTPPERTLACAACHVEASDGSFSGALRPNQRFTKSLSSLARMSISRHFTQT